MNDITLKSFGGDELATTVFKNKYALRNSENEILENTLDDVYNRNFKELNKFDKTDFSPLKKYFLGAGRILYALGNEYDKTATFGNCYVTSIEDDSIEEIFNTAKRQARIFSKGGGVGFDISKLRPKGFIVNNSAKYTSGAVSFMNLYSMVTGIIAQFGRRGALMLSMDVNHIDIIDFIKIKGGKDKTLVEYANISVKITNDFMEAVLNDRDWKMSFTLKSGDVIEKTEKATLIWDLLVESNWKGAEPGILLWDNIINNDPASIFDETRPISTNPCGEEPLEKGGICNLGSLNLNMFVNNSFTDDSEFNYDKFKEIIKLGVRFLDDVNILNLERQPLQENIDALELGNRIGLGITGLADMLIRMNIKYDSQDAIDLLDKVFNTLKKETILASIELAKERGSCKVLEKYKNTDKYKEWYNHEYFKVLSESDFSNLKEYGTRNIGYNTIAPNGSLSIILQTSSGLEPIFALSYDRRVSLGKDKEKTIVVYHPLVKEYNNIYGKDAHLKNENFITAKDIDWKMRIKLQSTIQSHISQSLSSTINLPKETTKETISNIYKEAYKQNLKGITIYRDGSRDGVLKETTKDKRQYKILDSVTISDDGISNRKTFRQGNKKWYVHYSINEKTDLPDSLFVTTNSSESNILTDDIIEKLISLSKKYIKDKFVNKIIESSHTQSNVQKMARMMSLLLRHQIPIVEIIRTIDEIDPPVYSFIFQIKKILGMFIEGEYIGDGERCPDCDSVLVYQEGCKSCQNCGFSFCG